MFQNVRFYQWVSYHLVIINQLWLQAFLQSYYKEIHKKVLINIRTFGRRPSPDVPNFSEKFQHISYTYAVNVWKYIEVGFLFLVAANDCIQYTYIRNFHTGALHFFSFLIQSSFFSFAYNWIEKGRLVSKHFALS